MWEINIYRADWSFSFEEQRLHLSVMVKLRMRVRPVRN